MEISSMTDTVVVTRHQALTQFLCEDLGYEPDLPVLTHATAEAVRGKHVVGVLPLHLAAEAQSLTTVDLDLPPEARGKELSLEELRQYFVGENTYIVQRKQ